MKTKKAPKRVAFAQKLKKAREAIGWSQARLAREAGLPQQTVNHYETAHREPSLSAAAALAAALGMTLDSLC